MSHNAPASTVNGRGAGEVVSRGIDRPGARLKLLLHQAASPIESIGGPHYDARMSVDDPSGRAPTCTKRTPRQPLPGGRGSDQGHGTAPGPWGGTRRYTTWVAVLLWLSGLLAFALAWAMVNTRIVNTVTYAVTKVDAPLLAPAQLPAVLLFAILAVIAWFRSRTPEGKSLSAATERGIPSEPRFSAFHAGLPLLVVMAVTALWMWRLGPGYLTICLLIVCAGWAVGLLANGVAIPGAVARFRKSAPIILTAAILTATIWHAHTQYVYWRHFMLGYADIGLFTTELEHGLLLNQVADRFADTRMGYHCIPLFYALVPLYALFRSPVFLMVVGPLALNLAAVPIYQLARARGQSAGAALLISLSWLALPSLSRLPYANTYGFQSIYLAVPFIAWSMSLALRGRWRASHVCLVLAMLCEETVCGVALGWGVYLTLFGPRRRTGVIIAVMALGYLALCTQVIIPHFAGSPVYSRLDLFGELSPGAAVGRLLRPRVAWYLLALAAPLLIGLWRAPRLLVIVIPTLLLVLLLRDHDYLNVKYWHQSTILPPLFIAAVVGLTGTTRGHDGTPAPAHAAGPVLGLFMTVLLFHQVIGFSPFSQAYRYHAANPALKTKDPRVDVVEFVQGQYPAGDTTVIATERLAAHFCDYRSVTPVACLLNDRPLDTPATRRPDVLVLDRGDSWDPVGRAGDLDEIIRWGRANAYHTVYESGSTIVLARSAP
jgi:uncharacterized membrane protein